LVVINFAWSFVGEYLTAVGFVAELSCAWEMPLKGNVEKDSYYFGFLVELIERLGLSTEVYSLAKFLVDYYLAPNWVRAH